MSGPLIRSDGVDELYERIVDTAMGLVRSDFGSLQRFEPERDELELLKWRGFHPASAEFWRVVRAESTSACGAVLRGATRVVIDDTERSDAIGADDLAQFRLSGIRAVQSTPLVSRGGVFVGVMSTHWRAPHRASARELGLLDVLARQAADAIERTHSEDALRRSTLALARVSAQLRDLAASQRTRRDADEARIARELHDQLGSELTSLRWQLESLRDGIGGRAGAEAERRLDALIPATERMLDSVRRIAAGLRPSMLDDLGLLEALEWQAREFWRQTGVPCECTSDVAVRELGSAQSTALYRIVQEALTNVRRHAQATAVSIELRARGDALAVIIQDDGLGIGREAVSGGQSLGLLGMRERAGLCGGTLHIEGSPSTGTRVEASAPRAEKLANA